MILKVNVKNDSTRLREIVLNREQVLQLLCESLRLDQSQVMMTAQGLNEIKLVELSIIKTNQTENIYTADDN